jgi:hypothetical protein
MEPSITQVGPDDFRVAPPDALLVARLHNSLAVCIHDAVQECGALLHLRISAPGQSRNLDLTDNTLSGNLSLLDRALRNLTAASPRAQDWRARVIAQCDVDDAARARARLLQDFLGEFLRDAGIKPAGDALHAEAEVEIQFRAAQGTLRVVAR